LSQLKRRSFTLVEVLVALSVISIGAITLADSFNVSLRAKSYAEKETVALFLLQQKASEIISGPILETGVFKGTFGNAYPVYRWEASLIPLERDLVRADIAVFWLDSGREHEVRIVTLASDIT